MFFPWFDWLARSHRILALDLPCSGRSAGGDPSGWTLARQADAVEVFLQETALEDPVILGHSYGSFVALTHLMRHPGSAAGVVASCGAASEDVFDDIVDRVGALEPAHLRDEVLAGFEAEAAVETAGDALAAWRAQLPFFLADPTGPAAATLAQALEKVVFQPATTRAEVAETYDVRDALRTARAPVLAIAGAEDRCTPPSAGEEIAELAPGGVLELVDDAGHFAYVEQPERYFAALEGWLADLD
jgi:proline iminopeptidase